jgi:hypothetical protein
MPSYLGIISLRPLQGSRVPLLAPGFRIFRADGAMDGSEDVSAGFSLTEVSGTTACLRLRTHLRLIVRRDEDDRGCILDRGKSPAQIQPGHPFELDVEYQTIKLRMLRVREERLCGWIGDRINVSGPQEPAYRLANALVIINNRDIDVRAAAHKTRVAIGTLG